MATPLYFPTPTSLLPNRLYRSMLNPNVYRGVSRTPPPASIFVLWKKNNIIYEYPDSNSKTIQKYIIRQFIKNVSLFQCFNGYKNFQVFSLWRDSLMNCKSQLIVCVFTVLKAVCLNLFKMSIFPHL